MKDEIIDRFNQIINSKNLNLKEISEVYDIPYTSLVSWKNGKRRPKVKTLEEKLNINPKWFLTGIGDMYKDSDTSVLSPDLPIIDMIKEKVIEDLTLNEISYIVDWYDKNINKLRKIIQASKE